MLWPPWALSWAKWEDIYNGFYFFAGIYWVTSLQIRSEILVANFTKKNNIYGFFGKNYPNLEKKSTKLESECGRYSWFPISCVIEIFLTTIHRWRLSYHFLWFLCGILENLLHIYTPLEKSPNLKKNGSNRSSYVGDSTDLKLAIFFRTFVTTG